MGTYFKIKHRKRNRRGAVLALMVMLVLLLSLTSLALIRVGHEARMRTVKSVAGTSARFAADAGVERTLYQMNEALQAGTWTLNDVPTFTSESLTACDADYTVTFTGDLTSGYEITSVGRSGDQTRTVRVTVELSSPFAVDYAVLTKNELEMKNKSLVSGYNSSDSSDTDVAVSIGTISTDKGSVDIKNGAQVEGDIYVGPGGDPDEVVLVKNFTLIEGEIFTMPMAPNFPVVTPPDFTVSKGKITENKETLTSSDSGKYSSISLKSDEELEVEGEVVLYITGDITLGKDAEIEVEEDATLTIYFDSDLTLKNSAEIMNKSEIPASVRLYGTGSNQEIDLKNSSDLYGVIYAPDATMTVHNKVNIYGSFIVGDFELKNSGDVYYDKALKDTSLDEEAIFFTITRWQEL